MSDNNFLRDQLVGLRQQTANIANQISYLIDELDRADAAAPELDEERRPLTFGKKEDFK